MPALGFVRKGQGMTSITGEKVHEMQVIEAVRRAFGVIGLPPAFFIVIADSQTARYRLLHETDAPPSTSQSEQAAATFDAVLSESNIEYAAKRSSGRLSPAEIIFVKPRTGEAVKTAAVTSGQREAQVKPPLLVDAARWRFDFGPYQWGHEE